MSKYTLHGYTTYQDNQDVLTGFVIKDNETSLKTKVSINEAKELANKGELDLPNLNDK